MVEAWCRRGRDLLEKPLLVDSALVAFVTVIAVAQQSSSVAQNPVTTRTFRGLLGGAAAVGILAAFTGTAQGTPPWDPPSR